MARKTKYTDDRQLDEPIELEEPMFDDAPEPPPASPWSDGQIWLRGFFAIVLGILFTFAAPILGVLSLVQFFWLLFTGEKNEAVADIGAKISQWMADAGRFGSGASEAKPFPWNDAG